jgi:hypothetical protein
MDGNAHRLPRAANDHDPLIKTLDPKGRPHRRAAVAPILCEKQAKADSPQLCASELRIIARSPSLLQLILPLPGSCALLFMSIRRQ